MAILCRIAERGGASLRNKLFLRYAPGASAEFSTLGDDVERIASSDILRVILIARQLLASLFLYYKSR